MAELSIFKRLVSGFLLILLVLAAIGTYSTVKLDALNQMIHSISSIDSGTIRMANRLRDVLLTQTKFEKKYVVSKDGDFLRQFLETEKYLEKDLEQIGPLMDTPEDEKLLTDIKLLYNRYLVVVQEEVALIAGGKAYSKKVYEEKKEGLTDHIVQNLEELINSKKAAIDNKIAVSEKIGPEASRVVAIITIISVIMGILIAFINARAINRPISLLIKGTKEIARGKFEKHLSLPSPPEINELAHAFNSMSDRLKELDEMKADLISHVSHEFRTPLAVIREAVSLSLDCVEAGSRDKQRRLLGIVEEECERLITSVNKVLDLSHMDAGMMDYHMEECSLSQLIEISVSKIEPIAERKKISLELDLAPNLPHAAVDEEKICQVLDNLVDNAMKFTSEKGKICIGARTIHTDGTEHMASKEKGFIEVFISDTGCGIPEEDIQHIFDKFKKLHEKGTGLGLHIAKQIVQAHGGDIWVESQEKTGSTFFFTVPVFLPS